MKRDGEDGPRLLPDGRALELIVESAGEGTEETDVLRLIADSWERLGISLFVKAEQREVFRNRIFSGDTMMSVWTGLENGVPMPQSLPSELAPTSQQQLEWPKWGQYFETHGQAGQPIDMPEPKELMKLYMDWRHALSHEEQEKLWHAMLQINADQVFTIGTVSGVPQPVVVSKRLHNVPEESIYSWDPGAHFGVYRPIASGSRTALKPRHSTGTERRGKTAGMLGYTVHRLVLMIPTLIAISIIVFVIIQLPPGDYLSTYIAELQSRANRSIPTDSVPAQPVRPRSTHLDPISHLDLGSDAGRSRLFVRIRITGFRGGRRSAFADCSGVGRYHPIHLPRGLSDRRFLRNSASTALATMY